MRLLLSVFIFVGLLASFGCNEKKKNNGSSTELILKDQIVGEWKEDVSVCNGATGTPTTYQAANITNKLKFNADGTYTHTNVTTGCTATRTGNYVINGDALTLSAPTVSCSLNPCEAPYQVNSSNKTLKCPSDISTSVLNFMGSADPTVLYLTPTSGADAVCYYKYSRL